MRFIPASMALAAVFSIGWGVGLNSFMRGPDWPNLPGCQLTPVGRYPSDDGADIATTLLRNCNDGKDITYFLRLDIQGRRPGNAGWWGINEIENDHYPENKPVVIWVKKNTVQVTISTRTLSGTLVEYEGNDIQFIRVYEPREPGKFPNLER